MSCHVVSLNAKELLRGTWMAVVVVVDDDDDEALFSLGFMQDSIDNTRDF